MTITITRLSKTMSRVRLECLIEIIYDVCLEITRFDRNLGEHQAHRVTENEIRFKYLLCQYDQLAPKGHSIVSETNEGTGHEKHDKQSERRHSEVPAPQKPLTQDVGIKENAVAKKAIDYEEPEMLSVLIIGIAPKLAEHQSFKIIQKSRSSESLTFKFYHIRCPTATCRLRAPLFHRVRSS